MRIASAALLLPTALACIWFGAGAWTALVAAAGGLLAWEWTRLCGIRMWSRPGITLLGAVFGAGLLALAGGYVAALGVLAAGALLLSRQRRWLGFGVLYIGVATIALIALRDDAGAGRSNVLFLFLVVWASDIGAYAAGRRFGGPRLAPGVSPHKTWTGAAGGLLAALAAGGIAAYVTTLGGGEPPPAVGPVLAAAALLGLLAQAGDLFESWIKRRFDVKDTSTLIPGHGGLLDRLDGVLAAAPAAAVLAGLQGTGRALWA